MEKLIEAKLNFKENRIKYDEKEKEVREALDNDDVAKARELKEELDSIRSYLNELEEEIGKLESEEDEEKEEENESEGEERMANTETRGVEYSIPHQVTNEETRAFQNYLETRDIDGDNLKTDSGFVVVPEEIVTDILKLKEKEFNLDQYVTVKQVSYGSGKYPVVRQSEVAALPEVEELEENPKLAVKPFFELRYDIKTHRGYFLISREAIEDAAVNVLAELKTWLARTIASTRNAAIVKALKEGTPGKDGENVQLETISATGVDGIKDAVNLNLKPNYEHNVAVVSQTAFNDLDKLKDSTGRYLLQEDIKDQTAKRLLGAKVVVLPDEMLGDDSASTIVIGNLKDAIVLFDRSQYQASWTNYMQFGESLMVAVRQDVRILDEESAIIIDFDADGKGGDDGDNGDDGEETP